MNLLPKQPISQKFVEDNCFPGQGDDDKFRVKFHHNDYIYVQWTIDDQLPPALDSDIRLMLPDGTVVQNLGLYPLQTINKNWLTLKFRPNELGITEGCYKLDWNLAPDTGSFFRAESNEFYITSNLDCTKLVTATCDCFGHGFDWSVFVLQWRVPFARFNPEYDLITEDNLDSDGRNEKFYAEHDKYYTCRTSEMDEGAHDALSCMLLCDTLLVDAVEYYFSKKDYALDNDKDGKTLLFNAQFQLRKQNFVTVNNNCQDCDEQNYPYYG